MAKQGAAGIGAMLEAVFPLWEDRRRGSQLRRKRNVIASSSLSLTSRDSACSASPLSPQNEQVRVDTKDRCDVVTSHGLATSLAERGRVEGSGGGVEGGKKGMGGIGIGVGEWWWASCGGESSERRRQGGGLYCQGEERGTGVTKARGTGNDKGRWRWWLENGNRGAQLVRRGITASPGHNGCDVACTHNSEEGVVESMGAGRGRRVLWRAVTRSLRQAVPEPACSDAMVPEASSSGLFGSAMLKKGRKREDNAKDNYRSDHDGGWGRFGGSWDEDQNSVAVKKANVGIAAWRSAAWASIVVASNPAFSACVDVSSRDPDLGISRPAEADEDELHLTSSSLSPMTRKGAGDGCGGGGRSPRQSGKAGGQANNWLADGMIAEGDTVHLRRRLRTQVVKRLEERVEPYICYEDGGRKEEEDMVGIRNTLPSCEQKLVLGIVAGSSALGRRREGVEDEEVEDEEGEDHTAEGRASTGLHKPGFVPPGPAQRRRSFSSSISLSELVAGNRRMLPVWERNGRRWRQYVWDGRKLQTIDIDVNSNTEAEREDEVGDEMDEEQQQSKRAGSNAVLLSLQRRLRRARRGLQSIFVPEDVTPDYWEYMRWRITQRTISSFNHVNATQSLLRAVGVGSKKILPAAAAVNWVLKDGLGRLGKLAYVARFGRTLDSELKRVRFTTSLLFTLSLGMEMTTPFFPHLFLPIATLANVGKSIGLAAYVATTPSMNKSFALMENMADVAAKGQAQTVVADNLGLALAVGLNAAIKDDNLRKIMPLTLYPVLASLDLYAIRKELKSVHLRTLNRERMEIIVDKWLESREVPSAHCVSEREQLFCPSWNHFPNLPLMIGGLSKAVSSPSDLCNLLLSTDPLRSSRRYHLAMTDISGLAAVGNPLAWICRPAKRRARAPRKQLVLSFRDDAEAADIIKGILHAGCLRSLLWPTYHQGGDGWGCTNHALSSSPSPGSSPSAASVHQQVRGEALTHEGEWGKSRPGRGSDKDNIFYESGCDNQRSYSTNYSHEEKGGDGQPRDWVLSPVSRSIDQALEESWRMAEKEFEPLVSAMLEKGWQTKIVTLASAERATFSLVRGGHETMVKKPHHSPRVVPSVS